MPDTPSQDPTPGPTIPPSPSPEESEPSSRASSRASAFVDDPGHFTPRDPEPEPEPGPEEEPQGQLYGLPAVLPEWEEDTVRMILEAKGKMIHQLAGVAEADWVYTAAELGAIVPPLTRILNRYDVTRAAAGTGDEIAVSIGLGGYVVRSYQERRRALAVLASQEEPITGEPAEPGTGPPPAEVNGEGSVEWKRGEA